jgi:DNA-binding MarR family transcriptional regulator
MIGAVVTGAPAPIRADLNEDPAAEVWRRIRAISHNPAAMAAFQQLAQETGLPFAPLRALLVLPLDEEISMRQFAKRLGCDYSYVTPLLDTLEGRGLAVRQPHPTDRRIKVIVLTDRGRELAQRAQLADTTPPVAFSALTKAEMASLRDLLRKLNGEAPLVPPDPSSGAHRRRPPIAPARSGRKR